MNSQLIYRIVSATIVAMFFATTVAVPAWAQRNDRDQGRYQRYEKSKDQDDQKDQQKDRGKSQPSGDTRDRGRTGDRRVVRPRSDARTNYYPWQRTTPPRRTVPDLRRQRDRDYPQRGTRVPALPPAHREYMHHGHRYYYHHGTWYRHSTSGFIVIFPPIGIAIPVLPPFYTVIWVGGVPYYYANGVYYVWQPSQRVYVVTEPPPEYAISEEPTAPEKLFIYPKKGQSEQQQEVDRYQCHAWAMDQTGFDPTRAGGNVPTADYFRKRDDYHRAMKACLEARGYSVQ